MIIETNLIDISKMTLQNYNKYNKRITYEIYRVSCIPRKKLKSNGVPISSEERKQHLKEYQHNYYLNVTKIKRKLAREYKK